MGLCLRCKDGVAYTRVKRYFFISAPSSRWGIGGGYEKCGLGLRVWGPEACMPSYQGCRRWGGGGSGAFFLNLHPRKNHPRVFRATCQRVEGLFPSNSDSRASFHIRDARQPFLLLFCLLGLQAFPG